MNGDLQIDSLLYALRSAGLRVGISEILRLQQVFACQPGLASGEVARDRLRSLLRAVLVNSVEDRATFNRLCDAWLDRAEEELELRQGLRKPVLALPPDRHRGSPKSRWGIYLRKPSTKAAALAVIFSILTGTVLFVVQKFVIDEPRPAPAVSQEPPPVETPRSEQRSAQPTRRTSMVTTASRWLLLFRPETGLAVLAWLGAGGLWLAVRRRGLRSKSEPLVPAEGPPRAFPLPLVPQRAVLLAPRDQEGLAWGIGRFVAEEPTRRLDLPATVRATALAGGLLKVRFHRARFYREVWLWVDEDANDPVLPRLAEEIEAALASHGLPVERAAFRGVPHRLVTSAGQVVAPNEIDERRDTALVAVLTDGRRLVRRYAADDQRVRIDALLRTLSHWPHLAFVDASREGNDLAAILDHHGIAAIAPEHAATFLSGTAAPRTSLPSASRLGREGEAAWAAVCALCPAPVDEATALELRRRLELAASPYSLQALRAEAPGPPGRLAWRTVDRIRRVSWLREAEAHPDGAVMPGSLLGRALDFWEGVYDRSLGEHVERTGEGTCGETAAERFLRMERALLGLWREPGDYIGELYRLYQSPLREAIGQHCEVLAPADWGGAGLIHLPWTWSERTLDERSKLQDMRLGGGMPRVGLRRRPGRVWLGIGLLVGFGLAAAGMGALRPACRNEEIEENGFVFVRICSGKFTMGSEAGDLQAGKDEMPAHRVTLDEFWMSKDEVTNEQYRKLHPDHKGESSLPVTGVHWFDARDFCESLGYRLPTEAEWEYAARAGTKTPWSFGSDERELGRFAWFDENSGNVPHPVGQKAPNPWGLHDMHGNVWEWVGDGYGLYWTERQVNPTGPPLWQYLRVLRGGTYLGRAKFLRSAVRNRAKPDSRGRDIGFRCVRSPSHRL